MVSRLRRLQMLAVVFAVAFWIACDDDPVSPFGLAIDPNNIDLIRGHWTLASTPYDLVDDPSWVRGTIRWHNLPPIPRDEVYSGDSSLGEGMLSPLRLIYRPRGYQAEGPDDDPCFTLVEKKSWGGIMRLFTPVRPYPGLPYGLGGQTRLVMRIKPSGGMLRVDFGHINENVDGDDRSDDESSDYLGYIVDPEVEDTGLDGLMDGEESTVCRGGYDPNDNPDPSGDNWWYEGYGKGAGNDNHPPVPASLWADPTYRDNVNDEWHWLHYEWLNGTEGNFDDGQCAGCADREDLGLDGLDIQDAYVSYEIPLDPSPTNPFVDASSEHNGWYTFNVPLINNAVCDTLKSHPALDVDWEKFTHIRIWFVQPEVGVDSLADMDSLWIAELRVERK